VCSDSEIGISITEGRFPLEMGVSIRISPKMGTRSLTQEKDWRKPISLSNVYARNTYNEFGITRPGNNVAGTQSYLSVSSVTAEVDKYDGGKDSSGKGWRLAGAGLAPIPSESCEGNRVCYSETRI
jgi:hypothetical protein